MLVAYLIVLRLVHVIASVCWVGGAFILFLFIEPTAKTLAPMGIQFMEHMIVKRRFSIFMVISSTLTVLSGALLVLRSAGGQWMTWLQTGPGLGFALGSVVGIAVYCVGMFGINPRALRLAKISDDIKKAGGPPTPEQAAELQKVDKEMSTLGKIDFVLVALSLALMATARYWLF